MRTVPPPVDDLTGKLRFNGEIVKAGGQWEDRAVSEADLVGNVLCLDFANTVNARPDPDRDSLDAFDTLAGWAARAGLPLTGPGPGAELAAARELREAVYGTFSAVVAGRDPGAADVAAIMVVHAAALLRWPGPRTVRELRWQVAVSAVQLLLEGPLDRVGECPSCHWLFLDTSRGGRRRWCSMTVCGSRAKARRYYAGR
jgi:predicted RNA-binding Zn ribbon-like protein